VIVHKFNRDEIGAILVAHIKKTHKFEGPAKIDYNIVGNERLDAEVSEINAKNT